MMNERVTLHLVHEDLRPMSLSEFRVTVSMLLVAAGGYVGIMALAVR